MKLSILIPTYNYDCTTLVGELHRQLLEVLPAGEGEIVVGDDGSTDMNIKASNREMKGWEGVVYHEEDRNRGRAGICNLLVNMAQGDYILILDSDARVITSYYLSRYLSLLPTTDVVCGGIRHSDTLPSTDVSLRWQYEKFCEPRLTAKRREVNAHQSMSTFNILLPTSVALSHPFDESITQYGYEDTLLGLWLKKDGIGVRHIDNPLLHTGLDSNERFLQKTEIAMDTLYKIRDKIGNFSHLLLVYRQIERWHLTWLLRLAFRLTHPLLRHNLLGPRPSVRLFNFYKLGFYATIAQREP